MLPLRAPLRWISMMSRLRGTRGFATPTSPKTTIFATTTEEYFSSMLEHSAEPRAAVKGEFVPVYVALGMILVSTSLGLHAAKQQLLYGPSVRVRKSLRETVAEVEYPERVVEEAHNFMGKSLFRKVAHVRGNFDIDRPVPNPIRADAFAHRPHAETPKSTGGNPKLH